jgi:hypothetical protein
MSQNDKNRYFITTFAVATIPTIGSALLVFLPDCTVTSQLFNVLNVLDQGFYAALFATMLVIAFVFMMGIRSITNRQWRSQTQPISIVECF